MKRPFGLRARLTLISAAAVAATIVAISGLAWWATARTMRAQVDQTLVDGPVATRLARGGAVLATTDPELLCTSSQQLPALLQPAVGTMQLIRADGSACPIGNSPAVRVTAADIATAEGAPASRIRDAVTGNGVRIRLITLPLRGGYAVMQWHDLTENDATLEGLARGLLLTGGLGAVGALTAGWIVARTGLRPLDRLTDAAEHVAATNDLQVPIEVRGNDEVARLAGAFNRMTAALEVGRQRQRQMIADAGHELRTPMTSLRTNIELLVRSDEESRPLRDSDRRDLLRSVSAQVDELAHLTAELTLLSHDEPAPAAVPVDLAQVVRHAVTRASRRGRHTITADIRPWHLTGDPSGLERAVLNLIDNAMKFSPPGSTVTVRLLNGRLEVSDEGPGIPEYEQPQVFQRFWRSPAARALPGSGLGLAIVADVAERHRATTWVSNSPSGGAAFYLRFPGDAH